MAEDTRGAPKYVPQSKNDRGSIPARSSSTDQRGRPGSEREGSSKDKTDSGHAPADAKKPGFPDAAPARSKSDPQETVSRSSPGVALSSSNTQSKTLSSPYYELGSNSGLTSGSPYGISETERLLAELTVLRGRKMPLDESQLPVSPMLERGPTASKGRRVSIDMLPTIGLISPRSALRTPEPRATSASQDAPTAPPTDLAKPALTTGPKEAERKASVSSIRSALSSRRKVSTDSQKRAVVYPPVLKVRGSSAATRTEGTAEPGTSLPPDQTSGRKEETRQRNK
ncbi:uncharacterized protein LOC142590925 [Dermacentor variabilis]|uniref:uncharacterized protein LOC142590925 n=1 Tax=Dermacentor variabilis TaxID=34621 RepID=UPI003F5C108E